MTQPDPFSQPPMTPPPGYPPAPVGPTGAPAAVAQTAAKKAQKKPKYKRTKAHRKRNPEGAMSLSDHLRELRDRLLWAAAAIAITTVFGFLWYQYSFLGIASLGDVLRGPYCSLPDSARVQLGADGECRLLATSPFEQFLLRLKVGATAGVVLASPVWLYHLWRFITPGLKKNERRYTFSFVSVAVVLFIAGAVTAYFVLAVGLQFLLTVGDSVQATALSGSQYFNFVIALLLIFGVSFEVPLIISMLNMVGILSYETLSKYRRVIFFLLFVFAAFLTPGQEPISMVILAFSLVVLVELSIQFARFNDKRRNKDRPDWLDLDDEAASSLDGPDAIGASPLEASDGFSPHAAPVQASPPPMQQPVPAGEPRVADYYPAYSGQPPAQGDLSQRRGTQFDDVL